MNEDGRGKALSAWHDLFTTPEAPMGAADRYEQLVGMADKLQRQDLITVEEKNVMILEATEQYASAVQEKGMSAAKARAWREVLRADDRHENSHRGTTYRHQSMMHGCT